jgi:hypothetical protein
VIAWDSDRIESAEFLSLRKTILARQLLFCSDLAPGYLVSEDRAVATHEPGVSDDEEGRQRPQPSPGAALDLPVHTSVLS